MNVYLTKVLEQLIILNLLYNPSWRNELPEKFKNSMSPKLFPEIYLTFKLIKQPTLSKVLTGRSLDLLLVFSENRIVFAFKLEF